MRPDDISDFNLLYDFNKGKFEETGNPLYVWETIFACCNEKDSLPEWNLYYLKEVAKKLLEITSTKEKAADLIKNALGFYSGKAFSHYHKPGEKYKIYNRILQERMKRKHGQKGDIFYDVGKEFNLSEDAIKKYFYEVTKEYRAYHGIRKEIEREEDNKYME